MKDFECYGEDSARRHRVDCVRRQIHQDLMHLGQRSQHNMGGGTLIKLSSRSLRAICIPSSSAHRAL